MDLARWEDFSVCYGIARVLKFPKSKEPTFKCLYDKDSQTFPFP